MLLGTKPYYTHSFGPMGTTLETALRTNFFQWFNLEENDRRAEAPGEVVRFRPSGEKFHDLCYLDALLAPGGQLVQIELVVQRAFLDGADHLFARDLAKSFLLAALPDACRNTMQDFVSEISAIGGSGETPGYLVFLGPRKDWNVQTGWTNLTLANLPVSETPCFVVHVSANPEAPNAKQIE